GLASPPAINKTTQANSTGLLTLIPPKRPLSCVHLLLTALAPLLPYETLFAPGYASGQLERLFHSCYLAKSVITEFQRQQVHVRRTDMESPLIGFPEVFKTCRFQAVLHDCVSSAAHTE